MRSIKLSPLVPLVLSCVLAACPRRSPPVRPEERRVGVTVQVAALEEVPELRRISGDVMPWEILPLSFKVGGRLARLFVEEGDRVRRGQLVALLDSKDYKLVNDLAKTQIEGLEPHLKRAEALARDLALPKAKLDELQSKMDAAKIQHQQARAQLSYAALQSPMEGLVLQKRVAPGDLVDPTRPVVVLGDLKRVKVILPVPQRDLGLFRRGASLELSAPGVSRKLSGQVHSIGYAADPKTRTFPCTLSVDNSDLVLRAGMVVEAALEVARHRGILVPLDAVSRDLAGNPRLLVLDRSERTESRSVKLGPLLGERILVAGGVQAGERIVVQGMVGPGELVVVTK
jgi:RND family efflux transporter MFP subunit